MYLLLFFFLLNQKAQESVLIAYSWHSTQGIYTLVSVPLPDPKGLFPFVTETYIENQEYYNLQKILGIVTLCYASRQ